MNPRSFFALFRPLQLDLAGALPVVGETHPLKARRTRLLLRGLFLAAMIHFSMILIWTMPRSGVTVSIPGPDREVRVNVQPPPIAPEATRPEPISVQIEIPEEVIGRPVPVTDHFSDLPTIATQEEIGRSHGTIDDEVWDDLPGGIVYEPPAPREDELPGPGQFVAFESAPVLINIPAPIYPELARQAEVEGTVVIRALVGTDGTVLDAVIADGIPMLNDAALAAVRKAHFKPALQQHRPVAVWVSIPIRFRLN
ncbi:MAG: TonB family protein [Candidatus Eisenbacteria bacterium]|nr:TonB family protein [Candidatus Latescibacterota bacterium]MBD3301536.1 TonB family protein [Candidatus Eisenbacteria bacterium]